MRIKALDAWIEGAFNQLQQNLYSLPNKEIDFVGINKFYQKIVLGEGEALRPSKKEQFHT